MFQKTNNKQLIFISGSRSEERHKVCGDDPFSTERGELGGHAAFAAGFFE
jgi:hypothetical protein